MHQYTILNRKALMAKFGAFYNNLLQIHPIYVIWAPSSSSLMKTPENQPIPIPNFGKKIPQKARTYTSYAYHVNLRTPTTTPSGPADKYLQRSYINEDSKVRLEKWNANVWNCGTVSQNWRLSANLRPAGKRLYVPILNIQKLKGLKRVKWDKID